MNHNIPHLTIDIVRELLSNTSTIHVGDEPVFKITGRYPRLKKAAVLMPLFEDKGEWHLLFTRRSDRLNDHKGQVSFPGGASELADPSIEFTALRESYEEIGLNPNDVEVLGKLSPRELVTGFVVTPIIGKIPWPYPFRIAAEEVARLFSIPFSWLIEEDNRYLRLHNFLGNDFRVLYFKEFDQETLWGASASMTLELLDALHLNNNLQ